MEAGAGLCREEVVRAVTREGPERIEELLALGAAFDRSATRRRSISVGRARTITRGWSTPRATPPAPRSCGRSRSAVEAEDRIEIRDHTLALELVVDRGRVVGVLCADADGRPFLIAANAVVLATGGIGQGLFRDHQPGRVHRRRSRHGGPGRRLAGGSRVRSVPPDGPRCQCRHHAAAHRGPAG